LLRAYYEADGVTIYHGDCRIVMPQLERCDHCITDPPYELQAHTLQRRLSGREKEVTVPVLDFAPIEENTRKDAARLMAGLSKRWTLVFCQMEAAMLWRAALEQGGARYKRSCIWVKPDAIPQLTGDRPAQGYETLVTCHHPGRSRWNGRGRPGVFTFSKHEGAGQEHATQKPLRLMLQLVVLFTDPGEIILDPFMGSGTTLRAAKDLGRRAVGIEIEEKYCELAARRMAQTVFNFDKVG
jgi:site-specific DNA-methyltransferase (adenine-specific)